MKRTWISLLLCIMGCKTHDITVVEYKPPPPIPKNNSMVVCLDKNLLPYREEVKREADKRFKDYVAIMASEVKDSSWKAIVNSQPSLVEDVQLNAAGLSGKKDVILFIDNSSNKVIDTQPNVFYFKGKVFGDSGLKVGITDAISTPRKHGSQR